MPMPPIDLAATLARALALHQRGEVVGRPGQGHPHGCSALDIAELGELGFQHAPQKLAHVVVGELVAEHDDLGSP